MRRRTSAIGILSGVVSLLTVTRALVALIEAISTVRDERSADAELLNLCRDGVGATSAKLREACLKARADAASPILFKALLFAASRAVDDIKECVTSPVSLLCMVGLVLGTLFLPLPRLWRSRGSSAWADFDEEGGGSSGRILVLTDGNGGSGKIKYL
jgi:hypothetical protein